MLKKILTVLAMFYALSAFAAVDVNKATAAELDGIKGIGPAISGKIIDERKKGNFKDWPDLVSRVNGVGDGNAAKFSSGGLTVNGAVFAGVTPAMKKDEKSVKADAKPAAPASAAATPPVKVDAKTQAKADKEAAKKAKAEEKAKKAEEKAAAAAAAAAKNVKADAPKPAASGVKK